MVFFSFLKCFWVCAFLGLGSWGLEFLVFFFGVVGIVGVVLGVLRGYWFRGLGVYTVLVLLKEFGLFWSLGCLGFGLLGVYRVLCIGFLGSESAGIRILGFSVLGFWSLVICGVLRCGLLDFGVFGFWFFFFFFFFSGFAVLLGSCFWDLCVFFFPFWGLGFWVLG